MANLVFVCPSGSQSTVTSLGQEMPRCSTGQGSWVDVDLLLASAANSGPEAAMVQVAMVGSVAFAGMKGLAIGLMR